VPRPLARVADLLERLGLSAVAFDLYQRGKALVAPAAPGLPPAYLRVLTAGTTHPVIYAGVGGNSAREIVALVGAMAWPSTQGRPCWISAAAAVGSRDLWPSPCRPRCTAAT
jgi:hypothetical protein